MAETKLNLKLLVDKRSNRVLFAEGGKDFVDFLFHLLSLPIGAVIQLFKSSKMAGSIGNLYSSFENMNEAYVQPNQSKDTLLKPPLQASASGIPMLLPETNQSPSIRNLYACGYNHRCVADSSNLFCSFCCCQTIYEVQFISSGRRAGSSERSDEGYVRGLVTYMVMDDLTVTPISMVSSVAMMQKCNIRDFSSLEERFVECGIEEGVEIMKASLMTKEVLTSVFILSKELNLGDISK